MLTTRQPMVGRTFVLTLAVGITFGFMFAYLVLTTSTYHIGELAMFPVSEQERMVGDPHHHSHLDNLPELKGDVGSHSDDEEFHKELLNVCINERGETFDRVGSWQVISMQKRGDDDPGQVCKAMSALQVFEDQLVVPHEDLVARELYDKVRVLCWIMTSPANHQKKARHVKATWGKRCNILLFMSSQNDTTLPTVALPVGEGRDNLWAKTKEAFKYVYRHHLDTVDWVMKADDDTYVVVENLRYMLSEHNSSEPVYFGCRFRPYTKQGYMSGGAGYVLSKEAVRRLIEEGLPNKHFCREDNGGAEDVEMGKCLERVNVRAMDSRDTMGRGRFFPFVPEHHLIPGHSDPNFWYWHYIYYPSPEGLDCCSDSAISFHYVSPNQMYVLEYLIYHLRPYGISHYVRPGPPSNVPPSQQLTADNR